MATFVLKNAKAYLGQHDISSRINRMTLQCMQEAKDSHTFGASSYQSFIPGLKSERLNISGYHDVTVTTLTPDNRIMDAAYWSTNTHVVSVGPDDDAAGDVLFSFKAVTAEYSPVDGDVGDVGPFSAGYVGNGTLMRGIVLFNDSIINTGVGAGLQLGGLAAGATARVAVHVTSITGTSLEVAIQQDDSVDFTGPVTRDFGLSVFTAAGSQMGSFTDAVGSTDDWWRVSYTLVGPAAEFVVSLMIP